MNSGVRRRGKTQMRKIKSEAKVVGFSSVPLFPTRKREAGNQGGTRGIDNTTGTGIAKGWEDK